MKPLQERLNDRLEQHMTSTTPGAHAASELLLLSDGQDPEVDDLVALAQRFQATPQLRVNPDFADVLERRMLRHFLDHQQKAARGWPFVRFFRMHRTLVTTLGLCLLLLLLGTGILVFAAQTSNPSNPLYSIKQWEQQMQYVLATSPADQAALDLQFAQDRLHTLSYLADQAHTDEYVQTLSRFDAQLTTAARAINALPAGTQRIQLAGRLSALQSDARQELRGFLHKLDSTASVATTTELGYLGEQIPVLSGATLILPAHPRGSATIRLVGSGIQPGAQLLVNGKRIQLSGTMQNGQIVFVLTWNGNEHPHSLGILNFDGTAAQTSSVTIETANKNDNGNSNQSGNNGNKNDSGNSNSNGRGKPETTPTPHGNV